MNVTPDQMLEAETMAKHYQWCRGQVLRKRGLRSVPYDLLPKQEKQVLTDTFLIILGAADKKLEDTQLKKVG